MKVFILALLPAVALGQLAGGISDTTVSATSEPVVFAVKAINEQFAKTSRNHSHDLRLLEVVHARTQVVAGQKLYLTLHLTGDYYYDVNVWYRAWLTGADRLIITDGPTCNQLHKVSARVGGLAGGISDPKPLPTTGDVENSAVLQALDFGACHLNDRINSMYAYIAGDGSGVTYTQQVTAGITYRFHNVPMLPTLCRNQGCDSMDLTACAINAHGGQPRWTCDLSVQYQAWMPNKFSMIDVSC